MREELGGCMVSKDRLHVTLLPLRLTEGDVKVAKERLDAVANRVTGRGGIKRWMKDDF